MSHTVRRSRGENAKIEWKKRRLESSRDLGRAADIKFISFNLSEHRCNRFLGANQKRVPNKTSPLGGTVPAKEATPDGTP